VDEEGNTISAGEEVEKEYITMSLTVEMKGDGVAYTEQEEVPFK